MQQSHSMVHPATTKYKLRLTCQKPVQNASLLAPATEMLAKSSISASRHKRLCM
jgi:hypothetical protein